MSFWDYDEEYLKKKMLSEKKYFERIVKDITKIQEISRKEDSEISGILAVNNKLQEYFQQINMVLNDCFSKNKYVKEKGIYKFIKIIREIEKELDLLEYEVKDEKIMTALKTNIEKDLRKTIKDAKKILNISKVKGLKKKKY